MSDAGSGTACRVPLCVVTVLPAPLWSLPPVEPDECCEGFFVPLPDEVVFEDPLRGGLEWIWCTGSHDERA